MAAGSDGPKFAWMDDVVRPREEKLIAYVDPQDNDDVFDQGIVEQLDGELIDADEEFEVITKPVAKPVAKPLAGRAVVTPDSDGESEAGQQAPRGPREDQFEALMQKRAAPRVAVGFERVQQGDEPAPLVRQASSQQTATWRKGVRLMLGIGALVTVAALLSCFVVFADETAQRPVVSGDGLSDVDTVATLH